MNNNEIKANGKALIPLLVFVGTYLGVGLTLHIKGVEMAFYQYPALTAAFIGCIVSFIMYKGTINDKFDVFIEGCSESNITTMVIIFILAGAFASVSRAMGGVDATVNFGLTYIPTKYIAGGLFIIASFISTATGTSMGAIAAVAPIAIGVATKTGIPLPYTLAAVTGGSMFGDNLSMISDTTIAATKTQGCEMSDKFKINLFIAAPAAIITVILLTIFAAPDSTTVLESYDYNIVKVLPYIFVLVIALAGVNVFVTLTSGIFISGIIGLFYGDMTLLSMSQEISGGFINMSEIVILSLLIGGMANMMSKAGGLQFILNGIKKLIKGEKSAEVGIAALAFITDAAIANNTVAIVVDGPVAKGICDEYKVDPRRSAALLDVFACACQGMIPYGAQLLVITSFTNGAISPFQVIPLLWYQHLLLISGVLSIFVPFADRVIKKHPWKWDNDKEEKIAQN
jgi:Na+/H+ antiporter NhaC